MNRVVLRSISLPLLVTAALAATGGCDSASPVDPAPVGGGREYVLDAAAYTAVVAPVLTAKGCDNVACHGGGLRGTFQLSPVDDKDHAWDFLQAARQVDGTDPAASLLLVKPLAENAGGAVHTAPDDPFGFASDQDPGYRAILAWIEEGEYR